MPYDIDDSRSFEDNVTAFLTELEAIDAKLAAALKAKLSELLKGNIAISDVWEALEVAARERAQ